MPIPQIPFSKSLKTNRHKITKRSKNSSLQIGLSFDYG